VKGVASKSAANAAADIGVRIRTGIVHRGGRSGWIGIGVAEAPLRCFEQALAALEGQKDFSADRPETTLLCQMHS
jgi:hypothetical protein